MEPKEETPLLKAIEKMLDEYLETGYISAYHLPAQSDFEKGLKEKLFVIGQRIKLERSEDPLTGLWSRQGFFRFLDSVFNMNTLDVRPCSLALLDIDHMRDFNFYYGPDEGEKVIKSLAHHAKMSLYHFGWLSRIGGDEFLCLFNCDLQEAKKLIEQFQESLKVLVVIDSAPEARATFKIGLTTLKNADTPASCLRRLEDAIHNVKNELIIV